MDVNSLAHTKWECKYHMECIRSDRTLKRIQNRALEKIITFMEEVSI